MNRKDLGGDGPKTGKWGDRKQASRTGWTQGLLPLAYSRNRAEKVSEWHEGIKKMRSF